MTSARYARQRAASRASSRMYRCIGYISQAMHRYIRRGEARTNISISGVCEMNTDSAVGDGRLVQAGVISRLFWSSLLPFRVSTASARFPFRVAWEEKDVLA
ncbi:hypothetical protein CUR178_03737 [Leishmania enriettii]|uniref:Uncharacterized protein n=1 Tax=Leishmania enriettii TaxID=5663 RepID=A0A836HDY7_LEIEN|nr:hypothetical protein CUR178_03737 [Leishmania enriettii]